ncbi:MAG: zinc-binding dehydrogenase [Acidimicrobiales bacterium]
MRAVVLTSYGDPEVLTLTEVPDPEAGPEDVVVEVVATALNRADLLQRRGFYPEPGPKRAHEIPGMELSGRVATVGSRVERWSPGDEVMAIVTGGATPSGWWSTSASSWPCPAGWRWPTPPPSPRSASPPTTRSWSRVGSAPAAGRSCTRVPRASGRWRSRLLGRWAPARSPPPPPARWRRFRRSAPTSWSTTAPRTSWRPSPRPPAVGGRRGARRGGRRLPGLQRGRAAPAARSCRWASWAAARPPSTWALLPKRAHLVGTVLRPRPLEEKAAASIRFAQEVVPAIEAGTIVPVIDRRFPIAEIADAHRHLEANANVGKVLIDL